MLPLTRVIIITITIIIVIKITIMIVIMIMIVIINTLCYKKNKSSYEVIKI